MKRLHTLLALLLLLILPVQGMAAVSAPLHKLQGMQATADMPCHSAAAQHDSTPAGEDKTHHNPGNENGSGHNCCHQMVSCVPSVEIHAPTQKFSDVPRTVLPLHTLFVPDSPDRPPRV